MNWFRKLFAKPQPVPQPEHDPAHCAKCGRRRHKRDKYEVLAWQHDECPTLALAEFMEGKHMKGEREC